MGLHFNIFSYSDFLDAVERLMVGVCGGNQICDCQSETGTVPTSHTEGGVPIRERPGARTMQRRGQCEDDGVIGYRRSHNFTYARNDERRGCEDEPHDQGAAATMLGIFVRPGEQLRNKKNRREAEIENEEDIPGRT